MYMGKMPSFSLEVEFDSKPLNNPDLRRFSLVLKSLDDSQHQMKIQGFLLPKNHSEIRPPSVILKSGRYDICTMTPQLQEVILNSFSFEQLFEVNKQPINISDCPLRQYLK
jgi:hypothetical protein